MQDDFQLFREDHFDHTTVHPIGLAALLVLIALVLFVPRRGVAIPFLLLACFIPSAQRVVVLGLDFTFLRLLFMAGWLRIITRRELGMRWQAPDVVIILWALTKLTAYTLLRGTPQSMLYATSQAVDALGMYFLFRNVVRGWSDVDRIARQFAWIVVPVTLAFAFERITGRNIFGIFGGVPEITEMRDGKLRCQGAFDHPILAGCFFAAFVPWMAALFWNRGRAEAVLGVLGALIVIVTCASSTPVLGLAAGLFAASLFFFRAYMRWIVLTAGVCIVGLHLVMKAPVWHLIGRIDIAGGSSSWHRFNLIDQSIQRFNEWALIGIEDTGHWGYYLFDVTNQYISEGVTGGVLCLCLFLLNLVLLFGRVGRLVHRSGRHTGQLIFSWALGVSLFVHAVNFIGVSYFGDILLCWYLMLATIVSLSETKRAQVRWRAARPPA